MPTRAHLLLITLCSFACGGPPPYEEPAYEPVPTTTGGHTPASGTPDQAAPEPTLDDKIRSAELTAQYEGVGDAPSPYEAQTQLATGSEAYAAAPAAHEVHVNGKLLGEPDFRELEVRVGKRPDPGRYWYDPRSGLWGLLGHGAGGVTLAGLRAEELARDASAGSSDVIINGRVLTHTEARMMVVLLGWNASDPGTYAGSYTLAADGKLHKAGGRYMGNLSTRARKARAAGKYSDATIECALTMLGGEHGALGKNVTINCD